ncbi:MAG: hypothetical protein Q8P00_07160 [Dehalococcoidia bacterium]|nr:hypothetical protein [Dehalococcoidia bacterium]
MAVWLYQMSVDIKPAEYRSDVHEGRPTRDFGSRQIRSKARNEPRLTDLIVLFFAPSGRRNPEPGIYGWGVIDSYDGVEKKIGFVTTSPSDVLKMRPLWDKGVKLLLDKIRGPVKRGTMWEVTPEDWTQIQVKVGAMFPPGTWPKRK